MARGTTWTKDRWREYVSRLLRVQSIAGEFVLTFPCTRGLSASDLEPFVKVHDMVERAALRLECLVVEHLGRESADPGGAIDLIRGRVQGLPSDRSKVWTRFHKDRVQPLSREQWTEWGWKAKEAYDLLIRMVGEVQHARGSRRHKEALRSAIKAMLTAKRCMEQLVCRRHPNWYHFARVFYGSWSPDLKGVAQASDASSGTPGLESLTEKVLQEPTA